MIRDTHFMRATMISAGLILSACASARDPQQAQLPDPLEAGWKGEKVCEVVQDNEAVRVLRCTFPPGVGHEKHFHAPHVGYALKGGAARIWDEQGEREATTPDGYSWWTPERTVHENLNIGTETSVYLIIEPKSAG